MKTPTRVQSIIFDLDGTLIDTLPGLLSTVHACLPGSTLDTTQLTHALSSGIDALFLQAAQQAYRTASDREQAFAQMKTRYDNDFLLQSGLYPGVNTVLEQLHAQQIPLGICTNRDRKSTLQLLRHHALESFFSSIICIDDVDMPKPHPSPLLQSMQALSSDTGNTLYVGDSHIDAQCAAAAGVDFAAHLCGYHSAIADLHPAIVHFKSFNELTTLTSN